MIDPDTVTVGISSLLSPVTRPSHEQVLGTRLVVPDVMRGLVERGLPELIVAGTAGHPDVAHAAAAFGSLPGCRTDAGLPADLGPTGPKLMTERATIRLVFENRNWHENDHAQAGGFSVLLRLISLAGARGRTGWHPWPGPGSGCRPRTRAARTVPARPMAVVHRPRGLPVQVRHGSPQACGALCFCGLTGGATVATAKSRPRRSLRPGRGVRGALAVRKQQLLQPVGDVAQFLGRHPGRAADELAPASGSRSRCSHCRSGRSTAAQRMRQGAQRPRIGGGGVVSRALVRHNSQHVLRKESCARHVDYPSSGGLAHSWAVPASMAWAIGSRTARCQPEQVPPNGSTPSKRAVDPGAGRMSRTCSTGCVQTRLRALPGRGGGAREIVRCGPRPGCTLSGLIRSASTSRPIARYMTGRGSARSGPALRVAR